MDGGLPHRYTAHRLLRRVLAGLLAVSMVSVPALADIREDFSSELTILHEELVEDMTEASSPDELTARAMVATAKAWAVVARYLCHRYNQPDTGQDFERIHLALEATIRGTSDPQIREVLGLEYWFRSLDTIALALSHYHQDRAVEGQVKAIRASVDDRYQPGDPPARSLATLSNGTMSMMALILRFTGPRQRFTEPVNEELAQRIADARAIAARTDVHYRGRLFLMALNNLEGCFNFTGMMTEAVDETLVPQADRIRDSWQEHAREKPSPARSLVLLATALAESTYPLALAMVRK